MYVVICRISSKIFFCGRSAGGGSASPSTPPTGRSNRPCTRVSARRRGQEERQKNAAVLSDRIIRLLRSVKVIRSGIPPPTGEHILTLPLTALCNCNVHYIKIPSGNSRLFNNRVIHFRNLITLREFPSDYLCLQNSVIPADGNPWGCFTGLPE